MMPLLGLVFLLIMLAALIVKSFPDEINEEVELVRFAALIVKLFADCMVEKLEIFPLAVTLKSPPEIMFFKLLSVARFRVKFPPDWMLFELVKLPADSVKFPLLKI